MIFVLFSMKIGTRFYQQSRAGFLHHYQQDCLLNIAKLRIDNNDYTLLFTTGLAYNLAGNIQSCVCAIILFRFILDFSRILSMI